MSRLINADALKELFSEVIGHIAKKPEMNGNLEHMIRASAMVIQMIDDAPTVQPEINRSEIPNNWIPCSEKLPEEYGEYLVTYKSDGEQIFMDIVEYETSFEYDHEKNRFKGNWLFADDCRSVNPEVLAWMPLPELYQERGEQE